MRRTLGVLLVIALALLAALAPSAAEAGSYRHRDAVHDVVAYSTNPQGTAVPARSDGDLTWSKVTYRPHRLILTLRAARLGRSVTSWGASYLIHTSKGPDRRIELTARPGRKTRVNIARLTSQGLVAVRCHVTRRVSYAHGFIRIKVPAHCLGAPRALRVAMGLTATTTTGTYQDDAHRTGGPTGVQFLYGALVRRG